MSAHTTMPQAVTRLAPSPTGALHLGNARTFLINWAIARQQGMRIVLRIEDLDSPRVKPGAVEQTLEDLRWLGIDWDAGPYFQRQDLRPYHDAIQALDNLGLIYPCRCSRKEILSAQSAPHADEHEIRYPATCRPPGIPPGTPGIPGILPESPESRPPGKREDVPRGDPTGQEPTALRVIIPDEPVGFTDELLGTQQINVQQEVGDFIVSSKAGLPAYQLAVVVDDARQGVTDVVRGDDLIRSTARQIWLYRFLGLGPVPRYWHLPLVFGSDGRRLAKRHGDTRLSWYRGRGVPPQRVIGLLAKWSGITDMLMPLSCQEFLSSFSLPQLSRAPIVFTDSDHHWLLANSGP